MYELIVIWDDNSKDIFSYRKREMAERTALEMKKCFGNQISWTGVREAR